MSLACPQCNSKAIKRNGYTRHGKQNHRCVECGRQFSLEPIEEITSNDYRVERLDGDKAKSFI